MQARRRCMLLFAAGIVSGTPVLAATPAVPLRTALLDTVERACVPALTGTVVWPRGPATGPEEEKLLATLGLAQGVPKVVVDAVGPQDQTLSRAILASRDAIDGAFAMALGGVEQSCRLLVYRATNPALVVPTFEAALTSPEAGWRFVPSPPTSGVAKRNFLKRFPSGHPVLLTLLSPGVDRPISTVVVVTAFPQGTKMPEGY